MCGFAGWIWSSSNAPSGAADAVACMAGAIRYRGPDSDGIIDAPFMRAAFRRLSIIDLSTGDQPCSNDSGDIQVFLNGEIYNHQDLRADLERDGIRTRGNSDTSILPFLYEKHGDDFVELLNGMFAILVCDHRRKRAVLYRDRLGIKPLYYAHIPRNPAGGVVFASEIKSLLAGGLVDREIDEASLLGALEYFYFPGNDTLIRGVKKLGPGERLILEGDMSPRIDKWWTLAVASRNKAEQHPDIKSLDDLLHDSVRRQLIADVPVGVSLSGGIDSSIVALCAADCGLSRVDAFTAFFPGHNEDELACSKLIAERCNLNLNVLTWNPADIEHDFARMVWYADEPVTDPAMYSALKVSEVAAQHVKVLLSGCGGDELFAGYLHHRLTSKQQLYLRAPRWVTDSLPIRLASSLTGKQHKHRELEALRHTRFDRHRSATTKLSPRDRSELAAWSRTRRDPFNPLRAAFAAASSADPVNQQLYADAVTYLPDQLLTMLDRATMAASIEGRVPLLDHRFVEAAFRIAGDAKLGYADNPKAILKQLGRGKLPTEVLTLRKRGFPAPVFEWIRGELRPHVEAILTAEDSFVARYLPSNWIHSLLADERAIHQSTDTLYSLLNFQVWYELNIANPTNDVPAASLLELFASNARA